MSACPEKSAALTGAPQRIRWNSQFRRPWRLQVDGIDAQYARLKAAGMTFVGDPVDFGVASAIYGRDPFGNVIELYELRDERIAQLERPVSRRSSGRSS